MITRAPTHNISTNCGCDRQILFIPNIFQTLILIVYYK